LKGKKVTATSFTEGGKIKRVSKRGGEKNPYDKGGGRALLFYELCHKKKRFLRTFPTVPSNAREKKTPANVPRGTIGKKIYVGRVWERGGPPAAVRNRRGGGKKASKRQREGRVLSSPRVEEKRPPVLSTCSCSKRRTAKGRTGTPSKWRGRGTLNFKKRKK